MRSLSAFAALAIGSLLLGGCQYPADPRDAAEFAEYRKIRDTPPVAPRSDLPNMTLTLAWNRETFEVPPPALVPTEVVASRAYKQWWRTGNVRNFEWTDADGRRYVVEAWARGADPNGGSTIPLIPYVSRFRPDGTLETKTTYMPDGPNEWTFYAADGKTPTVRVVNRQNGIEGTPFIQDVQFYDAEGTKARAYQANRYSVAYLEWFYDKSGSPVRWNGSGKLDGPLAQTP